MWTTAAEVLPVWFHTTNETISTSDQCLHDQDSQSTHSSLIKGNKKETSADKKPDQDGWDLGVCLLFPSHSNTHTHTLARTLHWDAATWQRGWRAYTKRTRRKWSPTYAPVSSGVWCLTGVFERRIAKQGKVSIKKKGMRRWRRHRHQPRTALPSCLTPHTLRQLNVGHTFIGKMG